MLKKAVCRYSKGFTLIELAIVLVIIGLLIGGVLIGRDVIKAAEIRSFVAQMEAYNTAVYTFQTKYNGIPGDFSQATTFGFTPRNGLSGRGDGNGLIESRNGTNTNQIFGQEPGMFWNDLSVAKLINGNFTTVASNGDSGAPIAVSAANVPLTFPASKLGRGNYITVGSMAGTNYWLTGGITSTAASGEYNLAANFTPYEAYSIDTKMDEGRPNTGIVQAHGTAGNSATPFSDPSSWAAASTAANCIMGGTSNSDTADTYNLIPATGGDTLACILRMRFN
jgi:prepilin-type N-terminal cleavage/methylation domain-containing protein